MKSRKIICVSAHTSFPPKTGGHSRTFNLNFELSKKGWFVSQFSACVRKNEIKKLKSFKIKINDNYVEYRYFNPFLQLPNHLLEIFALPPLCLHFSPWNFISNNFLEKELDSSDLAIIEHPWLFKKIYLKNKRRKPIVHNSHNIEFLLYKLPKIPCREKMSDVILEIEKFAFQNADFNFVCSEEEKQIAKQLYDVDDSLIEVIPNGVNVSKFSVYGDEKKAEYKWNLMGTDKRVILFAGSKHQPNIEAVKEIIKLSKIINDKNVIFVIVGKAGETFKHIRRDNVVITGYVDDSVPYFVAADIAINPMQSGSGTNIKMLEYMASGLPVISTPVGARGLDIKNNKHAIIVDIKDFPRSIIELLNDEVQQKNLSRNGRKLVEEKYDWGKIAEKEIKILEKLVQ